MIAIDDPDMVEFAVFMTDYNLHNHLNDHLNDQFRPIPFQKCTEKDFQKFYPIRNHQEDELEKLKAK